MSFPTYVPSSPGTVASFHEPMYAGSMSYGRSYGRHYGGTPMSMGGYYPHTMYPHTAAPVMMHQPSYGYGGYGMGMGMGMPYYGGQPTVVLSSPRRHRRSHRHRSRHSGFFGFL